MFKKKSVMLLLSLWELKCLMRFVPSRVEMLDEVRGLSYSPFVQDDLEAELAALEDEVMGPKMTSLPDVPSSVAGSYFFSLSLLF